jgi:thymidylate kinase
MGCMDFAQDYFWPKPKATVYYIEGNLGVGKSETMLELAEMLRENHGITVACLPQKEVEWAGKGLLAGMSSVEGMELFAAYGPLLDHAERAKYIEDQSTNYDVILVERHPSTTLEVFEHSTETTKLFHAVDAVSGLLRTPTHTIHLKNSPSVCCARTKRRGRVEDLTLDEAAFQDFDHKHEEMATKRQALGGNVYVSDALGADSHHHLVTSIAASIGYNKPPPPM